MQEGAAPEPRPGKDEIARERLEPLGEGERPVPVTIGAVIAFGLGISTVVLFAAGVDTGSGDARSPGTLVYAGLMLFMGVGMWRARYWAVLGFQALLVIVLVAASLGLVQATQATQAIGTSLLIVGAGAMFFFMIKAMARIQMPERPGRVDPD